MNINDAIEVWNIFLPDCRDEVEPCRTLLAGKELERAAKFFKPQDAERFILCRGLLRRILGEYLNTDPSTVSFRRNEDGKPFLPGGELDFNVSHSRDRLLIAVTTGRAVGVDIEFRRGGIHMDAIADRWFSPAEREFFQTLENPETGFFDLWARKEAYVKALGTGVFKNLAKMEVPLEFPMSGNCNGWIFQTLEVDPAYAAALVSEAPPVPVHLRTEVFG